MAPPPINIKKAMNPSHWKVFTKIGSYLNWYADSYLNLDFVSTAQNATGAQAYVITDTSSLISGVEVINSGWEYDPATQVSLSYVFGDSPGLLSQSDASIVFKNVTIFNPSQTISQGIGDVIMDISTSFVYPSVTFTSAIFLNPVSQGLVETEHLTFLEESSTGDWVMPYDTNNPTLIFRMDGKGDPEIQLFNINESDQIVEWSDELRIDVSRYIIGSGLMINIGFRSDDEGVYERKLRIYHLVGGQEFLLSEILVNAESIGEDERLDTLITNFGLPSPKDTPHLFKEADLDENLPDWQLLNYKSKHIILEHDKIMPYIGTYKALINAIKWLGYDDITVKEWFKNVKDSKKIALTVPYEAADRTKTILYFSADERRNLKKLNQLSLIYCITKETGEIDEWGNPLTENCYNYNLNEILVKLFALKQWLERWIIGVNTRITDITGEGIYFERFRNFLYSTQNVESNALLRQSLTPKTINPDSELVMGDASILLTLKEITDTPIKEYNNLRIKDLISYYWDPSNGAYSPDDASTVSYYDPSTIFVGSSFQFPFYNLFDIQWRASVEKPVAGVVTDNLVTNPLFIYQNEIRFWNILDRHTNFYDNSTGLNISLEKGFLRDPSSDIWEDSIAYKFYPDPISGAYFLESSTGFELYKVFGHINLIPDVSSELIYEFDSVYKVPLLSFTNYKFTDAFNNIIHLDKKYFLDIEDGKIVMDSSMTGEKGEIVDLQTFINWNYDTSLNEQKITLDVIYDSPRMPLFSYDPSLYWFYDIESGNQDPFLARAIDNSIYQLNVNHIGDYSIEIFGWDGQNNIYHNNLKTPYTVWTKFPTIISYLDVSILYFADTSIQSCLNICTSTYLSPEDISTLILNNLYPIFDPLVPLHGLTLEYTLDGSSFIKVPSISFFIDVPGAGSIARFYNLTEQCTSINGNNIIVNPQYQEFFAGDNINLVLWDKKSFSFLDEVSANIISGSGTSFTLNNFPSTWVGQEPSTEIYLINDTYRTIYNPINDTGAKTVTIDISSYTFRDNQLVGIIIDDLSTGYTWGSSFRVLDVSTTIFPTGTRHILKGNIPDFVISNPSRYALTAKHGFSSFVDFQIDIKDASEVDNNFDITLDDKYYHRFYLDNTFVYVDLLFDQEYVLDQWYDPSTDQLVSGPYYPYSKAINVDISTLVIFKSKFDPSTYMLNQKNIWTVRETKTSKMVLKVFNDILPFIFSQAGTYDVRVECYDKFGNLRTKDWQGLITVK
jgi:hypothetical protein